MPMAVEMLTPDSTPEQMRSAIAESIAQCVDEGGEQTQCTAQVYQMARQRTGDGAGSQSTRNIRRGLEDAQGTSTNPQSGVSDRVTRYV